MGTASIPRWQSLLVVLVSCLTLLFYSLSIETISASIAPEIESHARSLQENYRESILVGRSNRDAALSNLSFIPSTAFEDDDHTCTENRPCKNGACCGAGGFCGYCDEYCGKGCKSNCKAKAECGRCADPVGKGCPINVCCSKFGYCGTTELFCGDGCQPGSGSCGPAAVPSGGSTSDVRNNIIGYYSAWAARRSCHLYPPSAIPVQGMQRVNFAFAYIDPATYQIMTMDGQTPESLFREVTNIKSRSTSSAKIEVFVSIGGWTFNDNGTTTQPVFSDIASSSDKRQRFADNVVAFLDNYGFDGVDFDWEYPGAPDRGGRKEDIQNFPLLLETLNKALKRSPRNLRQTITIPSSYWYLRWFDLKGLVPHIDTFNMMTYDLHGVWDRDNPIGNIVQSHTNLTEIGLALELLWRNNIPPGKVILGLGFYGRAFKLKDAACSQPGCAFSAASNKGPCTNENGILGYFEIQDMLNDPHRKIDVIHDEKAAAKYFIYDQDQWISYDDEVTFKQKVEWANKIGLAGLLIWAIDLDDNKFSALSGLLGNKDLGNLGDAQAQTLAVDSWASETGQKCVMKGCGEHCTFGKEVEISRAKSCKGDKPICCPPNAMPTCQWRGGESGPSCHGQCHKGELTLFYDRNGDGGACYKPGLKAFCCTTQTFSDLINSCSYAGCGKDCPGGTESVAEKFDPQICEYPFGGKGPQNRKLCCPSGSGITNCHWVGKGTCDDNMCSDKDITLDLDDFGPNNKKCANGMNGRSKSLCCNPPSNSNPFLPVALDKIFPTLPPAIDIPKWDLSLLGMPESTAAPGFGGANDQGFGLIVIVGPKGSVTSLNKRQGSHYEFLECPKNDTASTVRIVCTDETEHSNCGDIYHEGVYGTVIEMPDDCGEGRYAVAHDLKTSKNQKIPDSHPHLHRREVLDLDMSYDFSIVELAKRDAGDVFIRIDYSNIPGYWNDLVNSSGEKRKRGTLDKRFFSKSPTSWGSRFDRLKDSAGTTLKGTMNTPIYGGTRDCPGNDKAFADINVEGTASANAKWGISIVGTISPFKIDQAYGFLDTSLELSAKLSMTTHNSFKVKDASENGLPSPVRAKSFDQPGLISLSPKLQVEVAVSGNMDIDSDFYTNFKVSTPERIRQTYPSTAGQGRGSSAVDFGLLHGKGIAKGNANGNLRLTLRPEMSIDAEIRWNGGLQMHERIMASTELFIGLTSDGNCGDINGGVTQAFTSLESLAGSFSPWSSDDKQTKPVGQKTDPVRLTRDCGNSQPDRPGGQQPLNPGTGGPTLKPPFILGIYNLLQCPSFLAGDNIFGPSPKDKDFCSPPDTGDGVPSFGLDEDGDELENQEDYLQKREILTQLAELDKEGNPRNFKIIINFLLRSVSYPGRTKLLKINPKIPYWVEPLAPGLAACTNFVAQKLDDASKPVAKGLKWIVEHIWEQANIAQFVRVASGSMPMPGDVPGVLPAPIPISVWEDWSTKSYAALGSLTGGNALSMSNVFSQLGTGAAAFATRLVICSKSLNDYKMRFWNLKQPIDLASKDEWAGKTISEKFNLLRTVIAVYSYMNHPDNAEILRTVYNAISDELFQYQTTYAKAGFGQYDMQGWWAAFQNHYFDAMSVRGQAFLTKALAAIEAQIQALPATNPDKADYLNTLGKFATEIPNLVFKKAWETT